MRFIPQFDQMDCGPACLAMVSAHYGKDYPLSFLREHSFLNREGVSLLGLNEAAKKIGFETATVKLSIEDLKQENHFPCILHWNQNHFVVLEKIKSNGVLSFMPSRDIFKIADPSHGFVKLTNNLFKKSWLSDEHEGVAFLLRPTQEFYDQAPPVEKGKSLSTILPYAKPFKYEFLQLFLTLLVGSIITLIFPFLSQALIDKGIGDKSINIVYTILAAQVFLFLGSSMIEIIRNWIILYIGARININIISDFLKKLFRLPINFFDSKQMGDYIQRIGDHERIEQFLTSQSLFTLFSLINVSIFFVVLGYYNILLVGVYLVLTTISITWAIVFLKKRKILDYQSFHSRVETQSSILEIIGGMQEIKLNDFGHVKSANWERIQVKLFRINQKILKIDQLQENGFSFINHLKNILVTFITANEVIKGNLTLGAMLSISYIIGQMNSPINQLITFFRSAQEATISLHRLLEVQNLKEEEESGQVIIKDAENNHPSNSAPAGIRIENLDFQFEGPNSQFVLKNNNIFIPAGKVTAIVGSSGSGKTTLLKLLLKFYSPIRGAIFVNEHNLNDVSSKSWRGNCGSVMQDGFIFSDTILQNIITGDENICEDRLLHAIVSSNLQEFINALPLGLNTRVGASGNGISGGQKQRLLIARVIYKNPEYIFFDEATSSLDSENEKIIMENLESFFKGKTVLIIAHRLSTVKNADQIIVLNKGEVVEVGNHHSLLQLKGRYYNLIKNQLDLGT